MYIVVIYIFFKNPENSKITTMEFITVKWVYLAVHALNVDRFIMSFCRSVGLSDWRGTPMGE